jgi:hypothetical protein
LNKAFQFQYKKSAYLGALRWLCALICSLGCALSAHYLFDQAIVSVVTLVLCFMLAAWPLSVEKSFHHAKTLEFLFPQVRSDETAPLFTVDGQNADLTAVWSCPLFSVLAASLLPASSLPANGVVGKTPRPISIKLLLGKDVMTDEQWHQFHLWRVWRQRG